MQSAQEPVFLTSFIGRREELLAARRLLQAGRLLTLVGPGGVGKTRLAVQLAEAVSREFPDGALSVSLAPISDPGLVLSTLAQSAGLRTVRSDALRPALAGLLATRRCLVVLDNFEHLLPAAPEIGWLLQVTSFLRVLVTSRAPLRITGERQLPVPPLQLPPSEDPTSVAASDAVRLFVERAAAVVPDFVLEDSNAPDIARVVRRLDGLPLALELAAARVRLLPPSAMLPRLERSLPVLVEGPHDAPERQRTLLRTLEWSEALLSPTARRMLPVCFVFRGGIGLDQLEAVGAAVGASDVLTAASELVDQSLLSASEPGRRARFTMLETVREFAGTRLAERGEAESAGAAHARTFLALAHEVGPKLYGPGVVAALHWFELEHDNLRAALDWLQEREPARALDMAESCYQFWEVGGHFSEGRDRLRRALAAAPEPTRARIRALNAAASLAMDQGDLGEASGLLEESTALSRRLGDRVGLVTALVWTARLHIWSEAAEAALPLLEEAGEGIAETGDAVVEARWRHFTGLAAYQLGRLDEARAVFERGVDHCRTIGLRTIEGSSLTLLGAVLGDVGEVDAAQSALEEALQIALDLSDHWMIPMQLSRLAAIAARRGRPRAAMKLAGAADAYGAATGSQLPQNWRALLQKWLEPARRQLGPSARRLVAEGRQLTLEQACSLASSRDPEGDGPDGWGRLTAREREVAKLVAVGLTNRQIAERLVLSVRTIDVHVEHVLRKLDVSNRTQLAALAAESSRPGPQ